MIVADRPGLLEEIPSGTEIVVQPVSGTSEMYGSDDLRLEASMVMDFVSYRRWRLPKLELDVVVEALWGMARAWGAAARVACFALACAVVPWLLAVRA